MACTTLVAVPVAVAALAGCSSAGSAQPSTPARAVSSGPGASAAQSTAAQSAATTRILARAGGLMIINGYIPQPASADVAAAYLTVANDANTSDELVKATSGVTNDVMPMDENDSGGVGSMTDMRQVSIPAHGTFVFTPGHAHLMLEKPDRTLRKGEHVTMTITFKRAGPVTVTLPVVAVTGLDGNLPSVGMSAMPSGAVPNGAVPSAGMSGMSGMPGDG